MVEKLQPSVFGRILRQLREGKNLTQEQLASQLEVDKSYITKLEGGTRGAPMRSSKLYENLSTVFDEEEVATLLISRGHLRFGSAITGSPNPEPRGMVVETGAAIFLFADEKTLTEQEVGILETEMSLLLKDFFHRRGQRVARLDQSLPTIPQNTQA